MAKLLIVESPGKIKKIQSILGSGWTVAASIGHVRDMPEKEIGVAAPRFIPQYVPTERGAQQIAKLKKLAKEASAVYLATDADREGESIAWHLKEAIGLKSPLRVTFREIEGPAIRQAIESPRSIDINLVAAQEARRVLDRLVGYKASGPLSRATGQKLSAGRVQSPTVRLMVERERAIRAFKKTIHFGAKLSFDGGWFAEWNPVPMLAKGEPYWMDKTFAEKVAGTKQVSVSSFASGDARRAPPAPFTTVTFQQAAYNRLKFNPDMAMQLAQKLYEQGAITYMRTDSTNLSAEALVDLAIEARGRGLKALDKPRQWKSKADAQEAHEAIRPTHFDADQAGETPDERKIYRLIWERAMACQIEDAIYAVRRAGLAAVVDGQAVSFQATGRTLKHKGWLAVQEGDDTDDQPAEADNPVPALVEGQSLEVARGEMLVKETKALPRFTKASLVREIESEGIGRPSTYATIIKTLESREYVEDKRDKLFATAKAETLFDAMLGKFSFFELPFTRLMEERLDAIAAGRDSYLATITAFHDQLEAELLAMPVAAQAVSTATSQHTSKDDELGVPCPVCGGVLRSQAKFIVCDTGDFRLWREIAGKKLTARDAVKLIKAGELPKMDGFTSKAGKPFSAGLKMSADKTKVEFVFG
jgi:DNA topoisomerase-1